MQVDARFGAFGLIEERFLNEKDRVLLGEARQELLRALPHEAPAQVAEDDDAVTVGVLVIANGDLALRLLRLFGARGAGGRFTRQTRSGIADAAADARLGDGRVALPV